MLYKIFLSVRSDYSKEAFYQLFAVNDQDYRIPLDGKEEWLNTDNSMVEIEILAKYKKLKIGFRKQASYDGAWIAAPIEIDVSQAVILTKEGKIKQVDAALLQMGQLSDANFLDNSKMRPAVSGAGKLAGGIIGKLVKDSSLADATKGIISNIPYAGIITALASVIWPDPSVNSLINDAEIRMRNLIITKIRQLDLANQKGAMEAIRDNLKEYKNAKGSARQRWMITILDDFNTVKNQLIRLDKEYVPGSVYLALDLAGLHLGMLRERIDFEKEIFADEEVDTQANIDTLKETVKAYQDLLAYACKEELNEREQQIKVTYKNSIGLGPRGLAGKASIIQILLRDNVRREIHRFSIEGSFNSITVNEPDKKQIKDAQYLVNKYTDQVKNEMKLRLLEDIEIPSKMLDWFIPGQENTHPVSLKEVFVVGPVTGLLQRDFNHPLIDRINYLKQAPGDIQWVQLVNMPGGIIPNFGYKAGKGKMRFSMGEKVDNKRLLKFERELSQNVYITKIESWWNRYPIAIRVYFSDGTDSGRLGEPKGGLYQSAGAKFMGLCQDFLGAQNESRKYGFRVMPSFYDS